MPTSKEGRIDFDKLKYELSLLDDMKTFKKPRADALELSEQQQAIMKMEEADHCFWDGIQAEISDNPDKILYCPLFDSACDADFKSRNLFSETVRHLTDAIQLDLTNPSFYLKRSAALAKLKLFDRSLADADAYVDLRPASPSGHCLRGASLHGLGELNAAVTAFRAGLQHGRIAYWDGSRVWSTGTDLQRALDAAAGELRGVVEAAKAANKHGLTWLELREYGQAS